MVRLRVILYIYFSSYAQAFLTLKVTKSRDIQCKVDLNTGPSEDSKSDLDVYGPLGKTIDTYFLRIFRARLSEALGVDSDLPQDDYQGIVKLCAAMNARYSDRTQVQNVAQQVLGTWLMGECKVNDVEIDGCGTIGRGQGLVVKRCRFLEESQCVSTCLNACKIPTEIFFHDKMGLPLTINPNYETFECQFSFGRMPDSKDEAELMATPCFAKCPTGGANRQQHLRTGRSRCKEKCTDDARSNRQLTVNDL